MNWLTKMSPATLEINRVCKFGEFLCAGASAAPERILRRVIGAPIAGGEREKVLLETLRVLRAKPGVEESALVGIHPTGIASPAKDMALQLHQVVGHTAFGVAPAQCPAELVRRRPPVLIQTGVADDVGTRGEDLGEEVLGNIAVAAIARDLIHTGRADDLGDVRIRVQALQFVAPLGQRIEKTWLLEEPGGGRGNAPFSSSRLN